MMHCRFPTRRDEKKLEIRKFFRWWPSARIMGLWPVTGCSTRWTHGLGGPCYNARSISTRSMGLRARALLYHYSRTASEGRATAVLRVFVRLVSFVTAKR